MSTLTDHDEQTIQHALEIRAFALRAALRCATKGDRAPVRAELRRVTRAWKAVTGQ